MKGHSKWIWVLVPACLSRVKHSEFLLSARFLLAFLLVEYNYQKDLVYGIKILISDHQYLPKEWNVWKTKENESVLGHVFTQHWMKMF